MTRTVLSIPMLAGVSILAISLASGPVVIDSHTMKFGNNAAFAQGGGGPGGGPGGGGGPAGERMGPGTGHGIGIQQEPMPHSDMTQQMRWPVMSRETIRSMQQRLNQLGYQAGPVDGIIGQRTRMAIAAYQTDMGMVSSGTLTPDLVGHMMRAPAQGSAN